MKFKVGDLVIYKEYNWSIDEEIPHPGMVLESKEGRPGSTLGYRKSPPKYLVHFPDGRDWINEEDLVPG